MEKESIYLLQKLDCNCNDCKFMVRDMKRQTSTNPQLVANAVRYGNCEKFNKEVSFIPNILQLETQDCFIHRKDQTTNIMNKGHNKDYQSVNDDFMDKLKACLKEPIQEQPEVISLSDAFEFDIWKSDNYFSFHKPTKLYHSHKFGIKDFTFEQLYTLFLSHKNSKQE